MSYQVSYSGPEIDAALQKASLVDTHANGWTKIDSSKESPISLDSLTSPGNYTIDNWTDGPTMDPTNAGPLNLCITSTTTTVEQCIYYLKNSYTRSYTLSTKTWDAWGKEERDTEYSITATAPANPGENAIWVDTTTAEKPEIKIFLNGAWHGMNPGNLMDESIYDPTGQKTDVFAYVDTAITNANLGTIETDFKTHTEDRTIHVTLEEKTSWNAKPTPEAFAAKVAEVQADMETKVLSKSTEMQTQVGGMTTSVDAYVADLSTHTGNTAIHTSATEKTDWNSKAAGDHTHLSDGRVEIDASDIVSGVVSVNRIDRAALERVVTVNNDADRMALTKEDVQDGDLVYVRGLNPWEAHRSMGSQHDIKNADRLFCSMLHGDAVGYAERYIRDPGTNDTESFNYYPHSSENVDAWWNMRITNISDVTGIDYSVAKKYVLTGLWVVNDLCILSLYDKTEGIQLYWSTDGHAWNRCTIDGLDATIAKNLYVEGGIAFSGTGYAAITRNIQDTPPTSEVVLSSADGKTWTGVSVDTSSFGVSRFRSIVYFKKSYYIFGSYERMADSRRVAMIVKSADGLTWAKDDSVDPESFDIVSPMNDSELEASIIVDDKLVITGYSSPMSMAPYHLDDPKLFLAESTDGSTWTRINSPQLDQMKQPTFRKDRILAPFVYVNGRYYTTSCARSGENATTNRSTIISSDNRIDWTYDSPTKSDGNDNTSYNYTSLLTKGTELAATFVSGAAPFVQCLDTNSTPAFYYVIHDTVLGTEDAFQRFSTGGSAIADWNNIKNKPTTLEQYGITDAYSSTEIDQKIDELNTKGSELLRDAMLVKPVADADYTTLETQLQTLTTALSNTGGMASSLDQMSSELDFYAKKIYALATS